MDAPIPGHHHEVPLILARLRRHLEDHGGLESPLMFSIEGSEEEQKILRDSLEDELNGSFDESLDCVDLPYHPTDIHAVASLIKVPSPLFRNILFLDVFGEKEVL
jgi:hypothetical protein